MSLINMLPCHLLPYHLIHLDTLYTFHFQYILLYTCHLIRFTWCMSLELATCYLINVTWYIVTCYMSLETYHLIHVSWYILLDTCPLIVTWYISLNKCHLIHVTSYISLDYLIHVRWIFLHITRIFTHVTWIVLHVTRIWIKCHLIKCHLVHVTW